MTSPASLPKPKKPKLFLLRRVTGTSMLPALKPGTIVIAVRPRHIRVGDIIIVVHDGLEKIKRITAIQDRHVFVQGDNAAASTDSRQFGWLPIEAVIANVVRLHL